MTHPVQVHSDIAELAFPAIRQLLLHEAKEHGLPVLTQEADHLMVGSPFGAFGITAQSKGVRLHVRAQTNDNLFVLRDALLEYLTHFLPDAASGIRWSDTPVAGTLPPNFQFAKVLGKEALGTDFYRLHLQLAKYDTFTDAAIHFRFVLPEQGNERPEWPSLKANGSVAWPQGEKTLHRPVYTARHLDPATGTMLVDVYRHGGGRMTERVKQVCEGADLALIGPGGTGVLDRAEVTLCGDETAYPALARIVESLPEGAKANVLLSNLSGAQDYPFPERDGGQLRWMTAPEPGAFAAAAAALHREQPMGFLWFAAEAAEVAEMRNHIKAEGWTKADIYAATYWTRLR